ncbi:DNA-processing protein DprA [candidate division KSB1 bacterium]
MVNIKDLLALSGVPDVGPMKIRNLIERFGNPEKVFNASKNELQTVDKISNKTANNIKTFDRETFASGQLKILEKTKSKIITFWDNEYPENLKNISDPPLFIFVKGDILPEDKSAISIVGSRKASVYGKIAAGNISRELAERGITIISGMAHGIDTIAHQGALKANGRTMAVLGCGIDIIYPKENKKLYEQICENGAVISEFPFRTKPEPGNFPRRNRIISGLSLGVVVIEAAEKSGALITAHLALEQNREVFAIPGNISSKKSQGTNKLIKESGAKLIQSVDDILVELEAHLHKSEKRERTSHIELNLSEKEKSIMNILSENPIYIDKISEQAEIPSQSALSVLLGLELKGLVSQLQGKQFIKL